MKQELIDFENWSKDNVTNALYNGIKLAIENYLKSSNSMLKQKARAVDKNEDIRESCIHKTDWCDVAHNRGITCKPCTFNK